jgi:hypothetical protein
MPNLTNGWESENGATAAPPKVDAPQRASRLAPWTRRASRCAAGHLTLLSGHKIPCHLELTAAFARSLAAASARTAIRLG